MNISKPIPVHHLPPPSGDDPIYLRSLIDKAAAQYVLADESAQVDYFAYIEQCKQRLAAVLA